jgi:sugar lactone lactonase YvrE
MHMLKFGKAGIGCIAATIAILAAAVPAQSEPGIVWATSGLKNPESVLPDPGGEFAYVSNIDGQPLDKDGKGFISKISLKDGTLIEPQWATGLSGPKGMALVKDRLYVSDIDRLAEIDTKTGKIVNSYEVEKPGFLNDVAADGEGRVYLSDSGTSAIWRLADGKLEKWLDGPQLKYPTGLLVQGDKLIVAAWGAPKTDNQTFAPANLIEISLKDKSVRDLGSGTPVGNLDGIVADGPDSYLVTDWVAGAVYRITAAGTADLVLDLDQGSADIAMIPGQRVLLIPMMNSGNLIAYRVD